MDSDFPNELELERLAQLIDRLITIFDPESQLESVDVKSKVDLLERRWNCGAFTTIT